MSTDNCMGRSISISVGDLWAAIDILYYFGYRQEIMIFVKITWMSMTAHIFTTDIDILPHVQFSGPPQHSKYVVFSGTLNFRNPKPKSDPGSSTIM